MQSIANRMVTRVRINLIRFRDAFSNGAAWVLILVGMLMFGAKTPMPVTDVLNLPHLATVVQTAGLMFLIFGFQIMVSIYVWPSVNFSEACTRAVRDGNIAAGLIVFGLLVFNGLSAIAFTLWLNGALGGQALGGG